MSVNEIFFFSNFKIIIWSDFSIRSGRFKAISKNKIRSLLCRNQKELKRFIFIFVYYKYDYITCDDDQHRNTGKPILLDYDIKKEKKKFFSRRFN